ncbi:GDP-L-fucose synthase family protein [Roseibacillus persicicus]|uniref:GDP-L-fucose synthase family protein n=1 Tax=Roseibacillus persicicus TaxID=454148 RepID=UPI00280C867A|nr:GDP-L-fucose synthase [Roseibacillus persicicus]MDQ8190590.1 GDP-L-fucose synthase [Roseibacillus persicicus]
MSDSCNLTPASSQKYYVAGHRGMIGSALVRALEAKGCTDIVKRTSAELDLRDQAATSAFLAEEKPDVVIIAAAKVGGIHANNTYPANFIHENLIIQDNLIQGSYQAGVERLVFLGSSCIYPKLAEQPMREDALLTGPLEPTNEAYAIAKIAGLKTCEYYRKQYGVTYHSVMPTNLYGPGDNYHPENSHVLPALIRRFHEAKVEGKKEVVMWGTGSPLREFLHADDCAAGILHLLDLPEPPDLVNLGSGVEITIKDLAHLIARIVGYEGEITHDLTKPDGTPRKLMDSTLVRSLGWSENHSLESGIQHAYDCFLRHGLVER